MEGTTHALVGVSTAVLVAQPKDIKSTVFVITLAFFASQLPDADSKKSKVSQYINNAILLIAGACIFQYFTIHTITLLDILNDKVSHTQIVGLSIIAGLILVCKLVPHRTYSHTVYMLAGFGIGFYLVFPMQGFIVFLVSYVSHLVIDSITVRGLKPLYPVPIKISLKLVTTGGKSEKVFVFVYIALFIMYFIGR